MTLRNAACVAGQGSHSRRPEEGGGDAGRAEDGLIIWSFNDQMDGYNPTIGGVMPDKGGVPLSGWRLNQYYFV